MAKLVEANFIMRWRFRYLKSCNRYSDTMESDSNNAGAFSVIVIVFKVAEHSFLVPIRYSSLFSNHWQLDSQNWQDASSTKI